MKDMAYVNVAAMIDCTESEGPGRRFGLWVQGCAKRCPGCCNPEMLQVVPNQVVRASTVVDRITQAAFNHGLEGITFVGGEPMIQARGLAEVAQGSKGLGLSVMVFTGYTIAELQRLEPVGWRDLLAATDILVEGPYIESLQDTRRNWAGSTNQVFHFLTERHSAGIEFDPRWRPSTEVRISVDGTLIVSGWPSLKVQ